jgi:diguanylate cyclase (GGDEF)-like protein
VENNNKSGLIGLMLGKTWAQRLATLLDWSPVDKGLIPLAMIIFVYAQYWCWGLYALSRPDHARLVDPAYMKILLTLNPTLLTGAVVLFLLGLLLRERKPGALWFQHVATQYFALSLVGISYFVGSLNFCAGLVLLGAPVFGFIILDRTVIWLSTASALVVMLGTVLLSALQLLPYAPVVVPPSDAASSAFWLLSYVSFAVPFFISIVLLADQAVAWWRQREDTIRNMSRTDALTGIHNRRSIMDLLDREVARTIRHGPPLSVVLLDLDHFKNINDTWGHPTGDRVLQAAAQIMRDTIRQSDVVGRYGGEEFMILLPETALKGACTLIERCREQLERTVIISDSGENVRVSASFGLACNQELEGFSAEVLIKAADEALYRAKEGGRNRVETIVLGPAAD